MITGAHESVAGGLHLALERARGDGCGAIQIFTKNSNSWHEPALPQEKLDAFRAAHAAMGDIPVLAHTSYLLNLGTDNAELLERSRDALVAEVVRSSLLGIAYVVLHPGAHLGAGEEAGVARVADSLVEVLARTEGHRARILLENTAGQGTSLGCRFEQLAGILEGADRGGDRLGVCFDTQHAFASGYNLSTDAGYDDTWERFDAVVGMRRLCALHLNDSKKPLGSRVDRHEHLGEGNLGLGPFWRLANDPRFADIPGVLETEPRDGEFPFRDEVALLRSLAGAPRPKPTAAPFSLALTPAPAPAKGAHPARGKKGDKKSTKTT
jgi:deoxyribonuclease-4